MRSERNSAAWMKPVVAVSSSVRRWSDRPTHGEARQKRAIQSKNNRPSARPFDVHGLPEEDRRDPIKLLLQTVKVLIKRRLADREE